ncbi:S1 family peptidase [Streptomyces sp. NPDC051322]|uniref:S1 family peptidase n=1 Tax=Streptomyces sp. NPDC051322 TaxID=3154645 RepID=UPI00344C1B35
MNRRTGLIAGASAVAVAAAAFLLPNADASSEHGPGVRSFAPQAAAQLGATLASALGDGTAGWYYNADVKQLVVNVLDPRTAERVDRTGAVAKVVRNSTADLKGAARTLRMTASVPGTAWSVDPKTDTVSVLADSTVTGPGMATLNRALSRLDGLVTAKRTTGEFTAFTGGRARGHRMARGGADGGNNGAADPTAPTAAAAGVQGGDAIFGGNVRCSLGFNVSMGGAPAFLTAGHCGNEADTWFADRTGTQQLGTVAATTFPVADFALVTYDDATTAAPSSVALGDGRAQDITHAADAAVGLEVQRSGSTSGLHGGTVTGLDATVNYGNGDIVNGLVQTDVCAEPGDSGGPLFAADAAIGLTSGGSGDCTAGGETFFMPVTAALAATGATIGADSAGEPGGTAATP